MLVLHNPQSSYRYAEYTEEEKNSNVDRVLVLNKLPASARCVRFPSGPMTPTVTDEKPSPVVSMRLYPMYTISCVTGHTFLEGH